MRFEHLRVMQLLITQAGLSQNLRLEHEFHKFLGFLPLDEYFWALLVDGYAEFSLSGAVIGIRLFQQLKAAPLEDLAQLFHIIFPDFLSIGR